VCGRFNVTLTPGLQALLDTLGSDLKLVERHNIAPTETVQLLRRRDGGAAELTDARWWLTPHWAKEPSQKYAMFNARSEGLAKSPAFRKPFASQRGMVPMSSFIEWRGSAGSKQPWLITSRDEALAVAALWDRWEGPDGTLLSCTIVTTAAPESFRPWHSRMPVLLAADEYARWLDNGSPVAADDPLFRPALKAPLRLVPIDRAVGNSRNKDSAVMAPVGEVVDLPADD
jgi:putative SOS response-associated peptidase YedK